MLFLKIKIKRLKQLPLLFLLFFGLHANAQIVVRLADYAKGDGTDETVKIQSALDAGKGNPVIVIPEKGKTYYFSSIRIRYSNVHIQGDGSSTFKTHPAAPQIASASYFKIQPTRRFTDTATIVVKEGSYTFTYPKASSLRVGEILFVAGGRYFAFGKKPVSTQDGWYSRVSKIVGNTVTMEMPAKRSFTSLKIHQYNLIENVKISQMRFDFKNRTNGYGVSFMTVSRCRIDSSVIEGTPTSSPSLRVGLQLHGVEVTAYKTRVIGGLLTNKIVSGVGYGINPSGQNITVSHCYVEGWKTRICGATREYFSSGTKYLYDTVVSAGGSGAGLDFHPNMSGVMIGNVIRSNEGDHSINIRSDSAEVSNNDILHRNYNRPGVVRAIYIFETAKKDVLIKNNKIVVESPPGHNLYSVMLSGNNDAGSWENIKIINNHLGAKVVVKGNVSGHIEITGNYLTTPEGYYSNIDLSGVTSLMRTGTYSINDNVFINKYANAYNFSVRTPSSSKNVAANTTKGSIVNNKTYLVNCSNKNVQYRILNNGNSVVDNKVVDCRIPPIAPRFVR
jgi:hypothetical protein